MYNESKKSREANAITHIDTHTKQNTHTHTHDATHTWCTAHMMQRTHGATHTWCSKWYNTHAIQHTHVTMHTHKLTMQYTHTSVGNKGNALWLFSYVCNFHRTRACTEEHCRRVPGTNGIALPCINGSTTLCVETYQRRPCAVTRGSQWSWEALQTPGPW